MTQDEDEQDTGFNITHVHAENPECPYCGEEFETPNEEGSHRATCSEAAFQENGAIPKKPDPSGKGDNVIDQYEKNNRRPGKQ